MERPLPAGEFGDVGVTEGMASAVQALDLAAGKPTPELSDRTADVRGRQWSTLQRHSRNRIRRREADTEDGDCLAGRVVIPFWGATAGRSRPASLMPVHRFRRISSNFVVPTTIRGRVAAPLRDKVDALAFRSRNTAMAPNHKGAN